MLGNKEKYCCKGCKKLADLEHNSDNTRIADCESISEEKIEYWNKKYTMSRQILLEQD